MSVLRQLLLATTVALVIALPAAADVGDPYLLATDPVTGQPFTAGAKVVVYSHEGRELRFDTQANADAFRAEPAKYLPAVDQALIAQQRPFYPLDTCPVSGEKLGPGAIDVVCRNRLVRLCCADCQPQLKNPDAVFAKLDAAVIAAQKPTYGAAQCVVSGEAFGGDMGEPFDIVIGNRLVRLCCKGCRKGLRSDPLRYLAKLGDAPGSR